MLSILIPTRDYTCYQLVADLHQQAEELGVPYEIIVAEDGSRSQVNIIANHKITELSHCRHLVNKENIGPANIRNLLAREAAYGWILFIDSDAQVKKADFLSTYYQHIGKADVVVGGLQHQQENHDPHRSLRFKYEKQADLHRSAAERSQQPYDKFTTFNFMMRRSTFLCILFDKTCKDYGYEDALFGVELKKRGISILHIDNPLIHLGLDINERFLEKSEQALHTLRALGGRMEQHSYVGRTYQRLHKRHLGGVIRGFHTLFGSLIKRNLLSAHPVLLFFSLYKLGYYATLKKELS
ncbi:MAG: glycosyltransferase [Bacteroidaceae bacterium]|nr:glycosyltransferase [Bacteroidaceae bacterium]